jgi:predicted porin
MKKTLIALAAMAATASFAQSTVELYGRADVTSEVGRKVTTSSSTTTTAGGVATRVVNGATGLTITPSVGVFPAAAVAAGTNKPSFTVQDGNTIGDGSSRFGLRGTEDLGGGLKAVFQFEAGVNIDDGSSGNGGGNLFSRTAMVGLEGGFGRVTAGRQVNPAFGVQAAGQVLGTMNGYIDAAASVIPAAGGVRSSNSVMYTTPDFGGLKVTALVAAAEDKGNALNAAGTSNTNTNNKPGMSLGLNYANGPLYLGFGYDVRKNATSTNTVATGVVTATAENKVDQWVVSAAYDLGMIKPFFSYTQAKTTIAALAGGVTSADAGKEKAYTLGFTAPMGSGLLFAEYGNSKTTIGTSTDTTAGVTVNNLLNTSIAGKETGYSLGYRYSLSKRTFVQAAYGTYKANADLNFAANGVSQSTNEVYKRSGLALTLSHAF